MVKQVTKPNPGRVLKTAWFSKAAKKAHIPDSELREAITQVIQGLADDMGGGVFKKRLNGNMHRSIILAKGGRHWVYEYLFAKQGGFKSEVQHMTNKVRCFAWEMINISKFRQMSVFA